MTTDLTDLAPCPFCGAGAGRIAECVVHLDIMRIFSVECLDCGAEIADDESAKAAVTHWNTRQASVHVQTEPVADFTALRDLIVEIAADLSGENPFWTAGCLADALIKKGVTTHAPTGRERALFEASKLALEMVENIKQTPDNVWYVDVFDPEITVGDVYTALSAAIATGDQP